MAEKPTGEEVQITNSEEAKKASGEVLSSIEAIKLNTEIAQLMKPNIKDSIGSNGIATILANNRMNVERQAQTIKNNVESIDYSTYDINHPNSLTVTYTIAGSKYPPLPINIASNQDLINSKGENVIIKNLMILIDEVDKKD